MNALRSPLNLGLVAIALCLLAAAVWMWSSSAPTPQWLPAADIKTASTGSEEKEVTPDPDLDTFANTWQSPLFNPDRAPDRQPKVDRASLDLAGITLTGVIIGGGQQVALLKQADGRDLKLAQGASLPNGWTLRRIEPLAAYFEYEGNVRELRLPAPRAQNSVLPKSQNAQQAPSGERKQ